MSKRILKNSNKTILILSLIAIGFAPAAAAQGTGTTASTSTPAAKQSLSPKDELMNKLRSSLKNPAEFTANLAELLNKYPYDDQAFSYIYLLTGSLKNEKNPETVRTLINQLVKNTEHVPEPLKADIYRYSANILFTNKFYADAADLSQKTIDLLNESDHIEFKRKQFEKLQAEAAKRQREKEMEEAIKKNPQLEKQLKEAQKTPRNPPQFNLSRAKSDFVGSKTNAYNSLGKSLWEQAKFIEAEKAYRDSFAVKVSKESALGIARAAEKNGKHTEALKYATVAALTGRLVPDEMNYFHSVYAKQHQGKTDGVEEYLNTEYRKTYRNAVRGQQYKKTANRSDRTVLIEFVTGAGCIPCIPFDYTFERALEDYSPKDVALVVYHTHAPTMDPLGNNSSDSRSEYYALNGAPNVFIDGQKFVNDGDYNGSEDDNKIQAVADAVYANLKSNLEIPAEAKIKLRAKRNGQKVSVSAEAGEFKNVSDDVTLHIALVENETAYSGENGLRFHPMVVRALAGDDEKRIFGFKIDPAKSNKFEYVFDVDKIVAQNLAYYDVHSAERMKEFLGRMGGKMPEGISMTFDFSYKRNQIDPNHLSVIAFLQNNKTKKILQSSQISLAKK
jgi:tetratricopeptide (TPR) repeat protein